MVIVGAGHAAVRAALSIRTAGYNGAITMIAEEGADAPYERPPLSKWSFESSTIDFKPIVPIQQLDDVQITRKTARAISLDPTSKSLKLGDETTVQYDRLLLATGARARQLPDHICNGTKVHYLRHRNDASALKKASITANRAVIIGGGFIGLEVAASLRVNGISVHVVEMANRLLSRAISPPIANIVHQLHLQNDVTFSFGVAVSNLRDTGASKLVSLNNGDELETDLIIAGVGSEPETTLAATASLAIGNGIVVDAHMQTSVPNIFAAGDCCSFPLYGDQTHMTRLEAWQAAGEQGELAGRNMAVAVKDFETATLTPWFWSEQYDHVLQVAGLASAELSTAERNYGADHHVSFGVGQNGGLAFACGIAPGTKIAKDIRFATKIIESTKQPRLSDLADPSVALKNLVRA